MNDADDFLEAELAAFRPRDPSPSLRHLVAEELAASPISDLRRIGGIVAAGGLAACLAMFVLLRHHGGPDMPAYPAPPPPLSIVHEAGPGSPPDLPAYPRAWAGSPEALESVLDQNARPDSPAALVRAFPRSAAEIQALIGEP
jgi:hypothetical protein